MTRRNRLHWPLLAAPAALWVVPAEAQNRSADNAVTQAEDAFGFTVGRESIGIYNGNNVRGFSPIAAGNVRIEGLYFDPPAFGLTGLLINSVGVKVGLSAQGYPFAAPSGIVDQTLRRPTDKFGGSVIASADSWGGRGVELDTSLPVTGTLGLRVGLNGSRTVYPNGTDGVAHTESVIARWKPAENVEIVPFWGRFDDYDDEAGTFYVPGGPYLGIPSRPHHEESPAWADNRISVSSAGVLTNVSLGKDWVVRLGAFRGTMAFKHAFNFLFLDQQPDGSADRLLIADPPRNDKSLSGELRVTRSILDGPRLHVFHLSARKRDAHREFGGSDFVDYGVGPLGQHIVDPKPVFHFTDKSVQRTRQTTVGLAYDGRWKDVGEVSFGISRANYDKETRLPNVASVVGKSRPWLYNGTAAVVVSPAVNVYAGYAKGLEESGTAPQSAANRNEPLPAIITEQKDAGVRVKVAAGLTAVAGVFDLTRPYFGYDSANLFGQVGSVRSRGAEFSLSGAVTPNLNIVFGGVILKPRVQKSADAQGNIGRKPTGLPTHLLNFNANWAAPFLKGLQFDVGVSHRGRQAATVDNLVYLPPRLNVNAGSRYGFKMAGKNATLRLQGGNLFNNTDVTGAGPGIYGARNSRQISGSLTVDY